MSWLQFFSDMTTPSQHKLEKSNPRAVWRGDLCFPWYKTTCLAIAAIVAAIVVAAAAQAAAAKAVQPNKHDCNDDERPHAGIIAVATKRVSVTRHLVTSILPTLEFVVVGGLHDHNITGDPKRLLFSLVIFTSLQTYKTRAKNN